MTYLAAGRKNLVLNTLWASLVSTVNEVNVPSLCMQRIGYVIVELSRRISYPVKDEHKDHTEAFTYSAEEILKEHF